jgi:hypothetical protein
MRTFCARPILHGLRTIRTLLRSVRSHVVQAFIVNCGRWSVNPELMATGPASELEQSDQTVSGAPITGEPDENDTALLTLDRQFNAIAAELHALCHVCNDRSSSCSGERSPHRASVQHGACEHPYDNGMTQRAEAILARLDPIERAIMATRARTITGLGVKARHAAYVVSQHWNAPLDRIDWDAQTVRLLIEAVCNVAQVPLPFRGSADGIMP